MDDIGLSGCVLMIVGGAQIVRGHFCVWQLDGILAAMGFFRETGGNPFRGLIRCTLRLWTNGRWITTCFIDTDRNEIAVAFVSSRPVVLGKEAFLSKKRICSDGVRSKFGPSVADTISTRKGGWCCSTLMGEDSCTGAGVMELFMWTVVSEDAAVR